MLGTDWAVPSCACSRARSSSSLQCTHTMAVQVSRLELHPRPDPPRAGGDNLELDVSSTVHLCELCRDTCTSRTHVADDVGVMATYKSVRGLKPAVLSNDRGPESRSASRRRKGVPGAQHCQSDSPSSVSRNALRVCSRQAMVYASLNVGGWRCQGRSGGEQIMYMVGGRRRPCQYCVEAGAVAGCGGASSRSAPGKSRCSP